MSIEKTYELIKKCVPYGMLIDSLEVVKQVEEYRQFWKPKEINVVLLAESHVYTDKQEYTILYNKLSLNKIIPNYPLHFVRFVYCLGYGENELLNRPLKKNTGTPQYWKIFTSCVAENECDLGFHKVLKSRKNGTPSFRQRIANKVNILRNMQEKGVWLLDASIVGLYGRGRKNLMNMKGIIEICWKNHLTNIILESNPKHIIIIGKGVSSILGPKLRKLDFSFTPIPQPQARGNSQWQLENYKKYQRICARWCTHA